MSLDQTYAVIAEAMASHDLLSTAEGLANEYQQPTVFVEVALFLLEDKGLVRRVESRRANGTPLIMWGKA